METYDYGEEFINISPTDALQRVFQLQRMATQLEAGIIHYCSMSDYMVGLAERHAIAEDIVNAAIEEERTTAEAGYDALNMWRRMYGRGVQGD